MSRISVLRDFAAAIVLFTITLGSLPVFTILVGPIDNMALSLFLGFGGWGIWCVFVVWLLERLDVGVEDGVTSEVNRDAE